MARHYDSRARALAARDTRRRILATARELIEAGGYDRFSVAALAEAAGLSPQTIYNAVGGKAEVLKATYDVTLAGDDEPVAMSDRPVVRALASADTVGRWAQAYAHYARDLYLRVGALVGAVLAPGGGLDRGAGEFAATIDRERRVGTTQVMTAFVARFGPATDARIARLVDVVWTLNAPEVYDRLVRRCGWTADEYEVWLARQLTAALTDIGP